MINNMDKLEYCLYSSNKEFFTACNKPLTGWLNKRGPCCISLFVTAEAPPPPSLFLFLSLTLSLSLSF